MNVVLDTLAFVRTFSGGSRRRLIEMWKRGAITLCLSPPILDEYLAVLDHLGGVEATNVQELLTVFVQAGHVRFTTRVPDLRAFTPDHDALIGDPAAQKFFACAVALEANYLVAADRTVQAVRRYLKIEVIDPAEFVRLYDTD